ncbi:MAG: lysine exporter LysO family protein [Tannerella sp.]|jgi:uncharacterized membrane protein YbjE (DUF340 family)|nr:lysine exporter LysO family protein [Tannerella sp.]
MKGSLIVVAFFAAGCLAGWLMNHQDLVIEDDITRCLLYLLMLQAGLSIGSDQHIGQLFKSIRPQLLLVPLATIAGTLSLTAAASVCISKWNTPECLATGSGFAYYSLSSVLITELKTAASGIQLATELGTVALMTNIIREITALLGAPFFARYFGRLAPICAGGATTMDTTLPVIIKYSGKDFVFIAILHGILVDLSVPFLITFFCSM